MYMKTHIWELPDKITEIDPSSEYTIVHDGIVLKKVTLEKLYSYFSQDYKIENLSKMFENLMEVENNRYNSLYLTLEEDISDYNEAITKLEEYFESNRKVTIEFEASINQISNDSESISLSLTTDYNKLSEVSYDFSDYKGVVEDYESRHDEIRNSIIKLNDTVYNLSNTKVDIIENNKYITETIPSVYANVFAKTNIQSELLTNSVNTQYDKLLAILDYYHHIFNEDTHQ